MGKLTIADFTKPTSNGGKFHFSLGDIQRMREAMVNFFDGVEVGDYLLQTVIISDRANVKISRPVHFHSSLPNGYRRWEFRQLWKKTRLPVVTRRTRSTTRASRL